jgi:hypothetical protein
MYLIHKITIRDWSYFTKTGDASGLKKYGVKDIEALNDQIDIELGGGVDFDKEKHKLNSKFKIQELITYYRNLNHLMVHHLKVELWLLEMGMETDANEKLKLIIEAKAKKLKDKFGIDVKTVEDLKKIDDEITRRIDKYSELTKETEIEVKGVTFSELVISVFKVLGYDKIDYDMVLSDFFELKKLAYKQTK